VLLAQAILHPAWRQTHIAAVQLHSCTTARTRDAACVLYGIPIVLVEVVLFFGYRVCASLLLFAMACTQLALRVRGGVQFGVITGLKRQVKGICACKQQRCRIHTVAFSNNWTVFSLLLLHVSAAERIAILRALQCCRTSAAYCATCEL